MNYNLFQKLGFNVTPYDGQPKWTGSSASQNLQDAAGSLPDIDTTDYTKMDNSACCPETLSDFLAADLSGTTGTLWATFIGLLTTEQKQALQQYQCAQIDAIRRLAYEDPATGIDTIFHSAMSHGQTYEQAQQAIATAKATIQQKYPKPAYT